LRGSILLGVFFLYTLWSAVPPKSSSWFSVFLAKLIIFALFLHFRSTGAMDPRCRIALVVAKMDYSHPSLQGKQQASSQHGAHTIVLVPLPHAQVKMIRPLTVFGYDDAPFGHAEVELQSVRLGKEHLISGEGSGFRVSQARLGPGRIHHCMRAIGMGKFLLLACLEHVLLPFYLFIVYQLV
jgi:hypothetical protein